MLNRLFASPIVLVWVAASQGMAQETDRSPQDALSRIVQVQASRPSGARTTAGGIVFGLRNDSIFIVTANHAIPEVAAVAVRVTPQDSMHAADIRWRDSLQDFAVLAFPVRDVRGDWRPRSTGETIARIGIGETFYAFSCAFQCWYPPNPVQFADIDSDSAEEDPGLGRQVFYVHGGYLEAGASGSPVVDWRGNVLGMIARGYSVSTIVVPWSTISGILNSCGFPINLPDSTDLKTPAWIFRAAVDGIPLPGRDWDSKPFGWGGRFQVGVSLPRSREIRFGIERSSYKLNRPLGTDSMNAPGALAYYASIGLHQRAQPLRETELPGDLLVGWGGGLLLPLAAWHADRVYGDSVDLATGERQWSAQTLEDRLSVGLFLDGEIRFHVSNRQSVFLETGFVLTGARFDGALSSLMRISVGIDHRTRLEL